MNNIKKITLDLKSSIKDAINNLQKSGSKIVLVTKNNKCFGTVTDGDIRRGILKNYKLEDSIKKIVTRKPIISKQKVSDKILIEKMLKNKINVIPIINDNQNFIDLKYLFNLRKSEVKKISNPLVIMIGGMGKRLMPYTKFTPKTLLKISGKPIIMHILDRVQQNGFSNIHLSINHLGKLIKKTIKQNNLNNLNIKFVLEKKKLDTAGSISLIKKDLKKDFIVTNGDVITNINYGDLLKFHTKFKADATMAVKKYEFKNPYGEIKIKKYHILDFIEKPTYSTYINAGVYAFHPKILKLLKYNEKITMIELFKKIKFNNFKILAYPIHENWIDIGTPEKYLAANKIVDEK